MSADQSAKSGPKSHAPRKDCVTGELYTHQALWRTAKTMARQGTETVEGSYYPLLASAGFTYFALEAVLNELLSELAPDVFERERSFFSALPYCGTLGKARYLASLCDVEIQVNRRPYQSLKDLEKARNRMVHARTQKYSILVDEGADQHRRQPMVALGDIATSKFVTRVMTDVESFCDVLVAGARAKYGDISVGSERGAFSGVDGWSHRGPVTDA